MRTFVSFNQYNFLALRTLLPKNVILFPIWNSIDDLTNLLSELDCNDEVIKTLIADIELWTYFEKLPDLLE